MTPFKFMEKLYGSWNYSLSDSQRWRFGDPSLHRFWLIHPCDRRTNKQTDRQNCDDQDALKAAAVFARKSYKKKLCNIYLYT